MRNDFGTIKYVILVTFLYPHCKVIAVNLHCFIFAFSFFTVALKNKKERHLHITVTIVEKATTLKREIQK